MVRVALNWISGPDPLAHQQVDLFLHSLPGGHRKHVAELRQEVGVSFVLRVSPVVVCRLLGLDDSVNRVEGGFFAQLLFGVLCRPVYGLEFLVGAVELVACLILLGIKLL